MGILPHGLKYTSIQASHYGHNHGVKSTQADEDAGGEEQLKWGRSTLLARSKAGVAPVRERFKRLAGELAAGALANELGALYRRLQELREQILEEIEIVSLRGASTGSGRLCPV